MVVYELNKRKKRNIHKIYIEWRADIEKMKDDINIDGMQNTMST